MARTTAKKTQKTYTAEEITEAFLALLNGDVSSAAEEDEDLEEEEFEDEDEDEEEDEGVEKGSLDREETESLGIKDLRALAVRAGLKEQKVKAGILAELEKKKFFAEEEEDAEEEEYEDEEDGDEDEEGYTREELEEMDLPELKEILKANKIRIPRGADQDTLIDLILDEDEEDEDEEEAEEEEEGDEEEMTLSEEDLKEMSLADLKALTQQLEIKVRVPRTATTDAKKKKVYRDAILATAEDEDE